MRARRLLPDLDLRGLPFAPVTRRIVLMAREGILEDVPAQVAQQLQSLLQEIVISPAVDAYPDLSASLKLL